MALEADDPQFEPFRLLARDWRRWQHFATDLSLKTPEAALLAAVAQRRSTWELMLTSVAYAIPDRREERNPRRVLLQVLEDVSSRDVTHTLPGFDDLANNIATLSPLTLYRAAPRLSHLVGIATPEAITAITRLDYCMAEYPEGGAAFLKCLMG